MHLTWHAANGDTLVIADPSQAVPEPMFRYLSSDGFGGTDNEIQTRRGAYQEFQSYNNPILTDRGGEGLPERRHFNPTIVRC